MKTVFVSNLYAETARGGAERIVQQEAESLSQAGHDVTVVSLAPVSPTSSQLSFQPPSWNPRNTPSIHVIHLPSTNIFHYLDLSKHTPLARLAWHLIDTFNSRTARTLAHLLTTSVIPGKRERDPESTEPPVVHTHNLMGLGFLIPATLRRHSLRHIHTVHDVQLLHPSGLLTGTKLSLPARVYAAIMRTLMGSPAVVIFPSTFLKNLHDSHGFFPRSKKIVLTNPAPVVEPTARTYPGPHFFFAGQLESHKGIIVLIEAWSMATQGNLASDNDVLQKPTLTIAGTGSLEAELTSATKSNSSIKFVGKLTPDQVRVEMLRSAWTIVPSTVIENAPAVIAESLSAGTPVIASNIGGIPEFIQEGSTGMLITPANIEALTTAIQKAITVPDWNIYSESCRILAAKKGINEHVKALESLYKDQPTS